MSAIGYQPTSSPIRKGFPGTGGVGQRTTRAPTLAVPGVLPTPVGPRPVAQAPTAPAGPGMTNTSTPNPTMGTVESSLLSAYQGDMGAGRAQQLAAGGIRDAAEGELKAMRGSTTRRGVSGGGLGGNLEAGIRSDTVRDIAGSNSAITADAEARRNALGGQISGQAAEAERLQNEQRRLAIQQMEAESQTRLNEERAQRQALEDQIKLFSQASELNDGDEDFMSSPQRSYGPQTFGAW